MELVEVISTQYDSEKVWRGGCIISSRSIWDTEQDWMTDR